MADLAKPSSRQPLASLHDVELSNLAAAGDRLAFGELARRHGSAVRALLKRMGAEPALADDLAQDAFLAAFEAIGDFRGEGAFVGWVKRIAARLYLKRWRRRAELDPVEADEDESCGGGEGAAAQKLDLDGALGALTPSERLCVSLCYGAGLSHAEAAAALKTPLGTVKSHVKRGLDKLKDRLAPPQDGDATGMERRSYV
jgi:RNA polymerase sigma-70 factor (ECF subfamily)